MNKRIRWLWIGSVLSIVAFCLWGLVVDSRELGLLKDEQQHLESLVGRMDVDDDTRIQVINIRNDVPHEILWHIYLPAGHAWRLSHRLVSGSSGYTSSGASSEPQDNLIRMRLVEKDGHWQFVIMNGSGSSISGIPDRVGEFFGRNWDELIVETVGGVQQSFSTDKVVTMLSVRVPDSLMSKAKADLGDHMVKQLRERPLVIYEIGTESAFSAREDRLKP